VRAAVYYNNSDVRVEEMPVPEIGVGETLVQIRASGICGSDVLEWYRVPKAPIVLGHEVAGDIALVGQGVSRLSVGQRVVVSHHVPCNTCRMCLTGNHTACHTLHTTNFDPGGFAEYVRLPTVNVDRGTFRLPDHVSYEEATFVEPLACVVRGMRVARFQPGQSVAVLGSGISGILFIRLARALGATRILATDPSPYRLDWARRSGADAAIPANVDVPARIREANGGRGADLVVVCTAALPAVGQAFRSADRGGTVLLFAPVQPGVTVPFPLFDAWNDGLSVVHSYAGPPADMLAALELIAARRLDVASMVTHRLGLARTGEGFELVAGGGESLKVIVEPQR